MEMLPFFGSLDDFVSHPPPFLFGSKKYLSQKNVVEKLNANVMHGKVRRGRGDSGQGALAPVCVAGWRGARPVGLCPGACRREGLGSQDLGVCHRRCVPAGLFLGQGVIWRKCSAKQTSSRILLKTVNYCCV